VIHRLDEVPSTQDYAKQLVDDGKASHGDVVVATVQTAGRGRRGRTWLLPEGSLAFSMVLEPSCALADGHKLTLGAAVGMLDAFRSLGIEARVKWPNDIVIASSAATHGRLGPFRKVAGILVEVAKADASTLKFAVLGCGVNVSGSSWPDEIALTAGALSDAGFLGDAEQVLRAAMTALPIALKDAIDAWPSTLAMLRAKSATIGRRVEVDSVVGEARAILDDGALLVVDDAGAGYTIRAGDVWFA
jgi:BirA family biotin operon repressor/biotin-[acetyl-CoA-carboxylase] ligase